MVAGRSVGKMIEDGFSGNREESREGGWPRWKHGQYAWEFQREGELVCFKGKDLPDRQTDRKRADSLTD